MRAQILIAILLVLVVSACASATSTPTPVPPTAAPVQPTATRVPPTVTPTPRLAPTTEELLKIIAEIPLDAFPFLKDKELMNWLQKGDPTPTPTPPLPAGPMNLKWTASDGTPYEFVYYPPKRAPALMLFVYFPIIHGLESDADWALWLQYFGKQPKSSLPYRIPGMAAPMLQSPNDLTAVLSLNKYPGCSTPCRMDEMTRFEQKWEQDMREWGVEFGKALQREMLREQWERLLSGTDQRMQVVFGGKSYGAYAAMNACAATLNCAGVVANSPYIPSQSSQKTNQVGQQLQARQVPVDLFTYAQDPYFPPFQNVSGTPWKTYTVPGQLHGIDLPDLMKLPDFKNALYRCAKADTGKLQAELNQKKAELENKRKELREAQQKLDKLARLLQDKRMQDLAQAGGELFVSLEESERASLEEALKRTNMSRNEAWAGLRELHGDTAVKEFQNAFAQVLNREADKVVALHAQVRELEAKVKDLERQMEYDSTYCSTKK